MSLAMVAFAGLVLLGLFLYYAWQRGGEWKPPDTSPFGDQMAALAARAVDAAREAYEVELDYTPDSVERLEEILRQIHAEHARRPLAEGRLAAEAHRWGAYVGETARRVRDGEWQRDSVHVGANAMPLLLGDEDEIYPCAWCYRRIVNGDEDNVWHKFQVSILDRGRAIPVSPDGSVSGSLRASRRRRRTRRCSGRSPPSFRLRPAQCWADV